MTFRDVISTVFNYTVVSRVWLMKFQRDVPVWRSGHRGNYPRMDTRSSVHHFYRRKVDRGEIVTSASPASFEAASSSYSRIFEISGIPYGAGSPRMVVQKLEGFSRLIFLNTFHCSLVF